MTTLSPNFFYDTKKKTITNQNTNDDKSIKFACVESYVITEKLTLQNFLENNKGNVVVIYMNQKDGSPYHPTPHGYKTIRVFVDDGTISKF